MCPVQSLRISPGRAKGPQACFLGALILGQLQLWDHCSSRVTCPEFTSYPTNVVYLPACYGAQCGYLLST